MESQLPRTDGHHYESSDLSGNPSALHSGVEGHPEGEGHHEKTSVLKKVKAKAKKIKNTLTKHGHSHDDEYEEEDEDEEMGEDPEIHGSPIHESEAVRGETRATSGHPTTGGTNLDRPSKVVGDPHYDSTMPTAGGTDLDRPSMVGGPHHDSAKPIAGGTNLDRPSMVGTGGPHHDSTKPAAAGTILDRPPMDGDPHHDSTKPAAAGTILDRPSIDGDPHHDSTKPAAAGTILDGPSMVGPHHDSTKLDAAGTILKEDKHAPLPSKPVDSRSGEDMYSELPHKGINTRTGRDVDEGRKNPDQLGGPDAMEGIRGGLGTTGSEVDPQGPNIRAHPSPAQVKTIDPAGRDSEEVEGITPVIKSFNKMGISEEIPKTEQAEGLNTGSHDQFDPDPMPRESSDSVPKSYNAANPRDVPGDVYDPARNSSTYTEKITSAPAAAASAIAGTAQSAKNVIASKIEQMRKPGEGNKTGSVMGTASDNAQGSKTGSVMVTASDYAHKIVATVTDTLAPVYGKVVGVGSGASSKVSGAETTQESGGSAGQDRGVSVTENWVEKLKPGEEDRALSSMITESFGMRKGEKVEDVPSGGGGGGRSNSQIVSDAVHERGPEGSEERKPMGKVTESEEVAKRLGTGEEGSGLENVGTGAGVFNKFTGAIGSWLGGQGGRAHSTPGTTVADDNEGDTGKNAADAEGVAGERRLQESSN